MELQLQPISNQPELEDLNADYRLKQVGNSPPPVRIYTVVLPRPTAQDQPGASGFWCDECEIVMPPETLNFGDCPQCGKEVTIACTYNRASGHLLWREGDD